MRPRPGRPPKTLWVREPFAGQILIGRKTIEVRVGYDNILHLQPGDLLKLNDQHLLVILRIGHYAGFDELLAHEDATAIAPDLAPGDLLVALREIYPSEKEALGVVALEVAPASSAGERYDAVLFDMGYTLIYFEPLQSVIVREALQDVGIQRSVEAIEAAAQEVWGQYYQDAATGTFPASEEYDQQVQVKLSRNLLSRLNVDDERALRAYMDSLEARLSRPGVVKCYPEVLEVLSLLQAQGYRLGIVSNWSWNLRARVDQAHLSRFFELVWASAYAGCNKPHPAIFQQALEKMGLAPVRALYVGDSYEHDVVGAQSAGLDAVLLDRAGTSSALDCPVTRDLWGIFSFIQA